MATRRIKPAASAASATPAAVETKVKKAATPAAKKAVKAAKAKPATPVDEEPTATATAAPAPAVAVVRAKKAKPELNWLLRRFKNFLAAQYADPTERRAFRDKAHPLESYKAVRALIPIDEASWIETLEQFFSME